MVTAVKTRPKQFSNGIALGLFLVAGERPSDSPAAARGDYVTVPPQVWTWAGPWVKVIAQSDGVPCSPVRLARAITIVTGAEVVQSLQVFCEDIAVTWCQ